MILRSTKKFFQKTFQTVKSFLSGPNYHKLPKDNTTPGPLFDPYPSGNFVNTYSQLASHSELDKFYADFSNRWDSDQKANKKRSSNRGKNKTEPSLDPRKQEINEVVVPPSKGDTVITNLDVDINGRGSKGSGRGRRSSVIVKKLKELEVVDGGNIEHVMDIEEVLHYYSLLTCPTYLDIVDKFFTAVYAEFFSINSNSGHPVVL